MRIVRVETQYHFDCGCCAIEQQGRIVRTILCNQKHKKSTDRNKVTEAYEREKTIIQETSLEHAEVSERTS